MSSVNIYQALRRICDQYKQCEGQKEAFCQAIDDAVNELGIEALLSCDQNDTFISSLVADAPVEILAHVCTIAKEGGILEKVCQVSHKHVRTPLRTAAYWGRSAHAYYLMAIGTKIEVNDSGLTSIEMARANRHYALADKMEKLDTSGLQATVEDALAFAATIPPYNEDLTIILGSNPKKDAKETPEEGIKAVIRVISGCMSYALKEEDPLYEILNAVFRFHGAKTFTQLIKHNGMQTTATHQIAIKTSKTLRWLKTVLGDEGWRAALHTRDSNGDMPLHAVLKGSRGNIRFLMMNGAPLDAKDGNGATVKELLIKWGRFQHPDTVMKLIEMCP